MKEVYAYDWDGVVVMPTESHPNGSPHPISMFETVKPNREVIEEVLDLLSRGKEVHVVTGRTTSLKALTVKQVLLYLGSKFPENRVHLDPAEDWTSDQATEDYKTAKLLEIRATHYTGDRFTDLRAAERAGCNFSFRGQLK